MKGTKHDRQSCPHCCKRTNAELVGICVGLIQCNLKVYSYNAAPKGVLQDTSTILAGAEHRGMHPPHEYIGRNSHVFYYAVNFFASETTPRAFEGGRRRVQKNSNKPPQRPCATQRCYLVKRQVLRLPIGPWKCTAGEHTRGCGGTYGQSARKPRVVD